MSRATTVNPSTDYKAASSEEEFSVVDVAGFMGIEINHNGQQMPDEVIAGHMVEKAISGLESITLDGGNKDVLPITEATTAVKVLTEKHISISPDKKYRLATELYVASQLLKDSLTDSDDGQVIAAREVLSVKCDQSLVALQKTAKYNVLAP